MKTWSVVFRHHRWSNLAMIDFLSTPSEDALVRSVPGTYGGSIDTIRHIISSDAEYARIIPHTPEIPQIEDDGPFDEGWEELRKVAGVAATTMVSYADGPTEDTFFVDVDEGTAQGNMPPKVSVWAWRTSEEGQEILRHLRPPVERER